jgi:VanZ family protein
MLKLIIWCKPFARYLLAAWIIAVFLVSSIPHLPTLKIHTARSEIRLDYLIHFCEYGFMALMTFLAFSDVKFRMSKWKWVLLTTGLAIFALADEYHQKFIPGRTYNIHDFLSNISGIITALIFCIIVFRMIARKGSQH